MNNLPIGESVLPASPAGGPGARLTLAELERAIQAADPAAFLLPPRILRRVIKQHARLAGFGLSVPHRKCYVIGREPLLEIVERAELGVADDAVLPQTILLLARPDLRQLAETPADEILVRCWRLLFHARVHAALDEQIAAGRLSSAAVRQRIHQIGSAEFHEIRMVLGQDDLLLPPRSDESVYVEFVAVYLELRRFAGSFLPRYFPGIENLAAIDELVQQDVDAERLFWATRPHGAPHPKDRCELVDVSDVSAEVASEAVEPLPPAEAPSETKYRLLMRRSQRPAALGNVVRAAIYRTRAARFAPLEHAGQAHAAITMDVFRLIRRLQSALELEDAEGQPWKDSLFALVSQTPRGNWTAEARLLYDLQKVCVDHEREIYTVDPVEWVLSWGRRPIKRWLPNQRDVLMLKHLRSAARRLAVVRFSDAHRRQLALLVEEAQDRVESRLREHLRPQIAAVLDAVGLTAQNLPERVARKKLVEELLDQIGERGFLTMGDLRDAISRNNVKLPNLSEPMDFLRGDQLLQADRKLALALDGVYRRGEFYLRWMQRLSSLGFGTRIGRFLTRFAVVPFGGSYVTVVFVHYVWELITGKGAHSATATTAEPPNIGEVAAKVWSELTSPSVLALGLFVLCLINSASFRRAVGVCFKVAYRALRAAVVEPILWLVESPLLQRILHSRVFTILMRFVVKPLVWTGIAWWLMSRGRPDWRMSGPSGLSIFLTFNLLLNSRVGRNLEELIFDAIAQGWRRFGLRMILGLFWFVIDLFKAILETAERLMYSVDEWLRFRSGEGNVLLVTKAALGVLWFFASYVLRFCITVLFEPQINPIKHFPVVTVGHKLLFGLYVPFAKLLESQLGMNAFQAWAISTTTIWSIPGVFGFLVWELKENWRLYGANRRRELSASPIGPHRETLGRLLKPGVHSGVLPKRYAKLRRAERHAREGGSWHTVQKHLHALHRVEVSIARWIERDFLELFAESRCWQAPPVSLKAVRLGANSVRLTFGCPGVDGTDLHMALEAEAGWLVSGVTSPGWLDRLLPHQRQVLATALIGLYKSAGIDLVRQQIEEQFAPPMPWYDVSADGLILWPDGAEDVEVLYALDGSQWIAPQSVRGLARRRLPTLQRRQLLFAEVPVPWDAWVAIWNQDAAGQCQPREPFAPLRVLPL